MLNQGTTLRMKFSAEMFKQIIATLRGDGSGARGHEKRTEGRVGLRSSVDIVPYAVDGKMAKAITVWIRDLSVNGVGLVSSVQLDAKLEFVIGFGLDGQKPLSVRYKVRHCKKLARDLHSIGASFERFEDDDQAKLLLGKLHSKIHAPKTPEEIAKSVAAPAAAAESNPDTKTKAA